jgi:hypothetical protein
MSANLRIVPTPKLSAYCVACGEQHSVVWMRTYLETLHKPGHVSRTGGILCGRCFERTMTEMATDDEAIPRVRAVAQKFLDVKAKRDTDRKDDDDR